MKIGLIGLGKMGMNLAENLIASKHQVVGYDADPTKEAEANEKGVTFSKTVEEFLALLPQEKIVWLMVPAGEPTEQMIQKMITKLSSKDMLIDGGNSHYEDSKRRAAQAAQKGITFFDVGTSGGTSGARKGACMMIGGNQADFQKIESIFKDLNVENGYFYAGKSGSGHYLKMVHNGIDYGMMQSIAEGFNVLHHSEYEYELADVAKVWNNGSVIRSWLMELTQSAFEKDSELNDIKGVIASSGEGQWTVEEALKLHVPVPVIAQSLMVRYASTDSDSFGEKIVASLRNEFGGHSVQSKED